jgi:hypothetical protein
MSKPSLSDLSDVVEKSRKASVQHAKQLATLTTFYEMLTRVVRKQAPVFLDIMGHLGEPFAAAIAHEKTLSEAESLLAENLHDLAARYEVVWRVTEETQEARRKVKEATQKIASLKTALAKDETKGALNKVKIEADIRAAVEAKRRAVDAAEAKLEELVRCRQAYNDFKIRRLRKGYANLGKTLVDAARGIQEALGELTARIQWAKDEMPAMLEGKVADVEAEAPAAEEEAENERPATPDPEPAQGDDE